MTAEKTVGKVYLVGAGPGDPGLLTVRGRDCLRHADVVVYDSLANTILLEYAPEAETIHVGKRRDAHTLPQEEINRVLVEQAHQGRHVVRLKGGDPFVFGRGGEEVLALQEAGVPFELVPGITAGIAGAAYAGIPVTRRGVSGSVTLITGHRQEDGDTESALRTLVQEGTLVFYMGVSNLPAIVEELRELGRPAEEPIAIIERATFGTQRTTLGTLETIVRDSYEARVQPPAIIVVGQVADMHKHVDWFEQRPLHGARFAVIRAGGQASKVVHLLRYHGADVLEVHVASVAPSAEVPALDAIQGYDWILLTSSNAVEMVLEGLRSRGQDVRALAGTRLCVLGKITIDALKRHCLVPDLIPSSHKTDVVVSALCEAAPGGLKGKKIFIARSDIVRSSLAPALTAAGADVVEQAAYKTTRPKQAREQVQSLFSFKPEAIVFTSSSSVHGLWEVLTESERNILKEQGVFAGLGPVTGAVAQSCDWPLTIAPDEHTAEGLVARLSAWYQTRYQDDVEG